MDHGDPMNAQQHGPGPIIHGQDVTNPNKFIVQDNAGPPQLLTAQEIAALPIRQQWFTGTANGLICTWPTRDIAETRCAQMGVILGQLLPVRLEQLERLLNLEHPEAIVILADPNGNPLRGA